MPDTPKHSVSVAGVVVGGSEEVLLIQRRDNGQWEPPGGVLEVEEEFEQGVCREVFEETGVHVQVERLTGVYKNLKKGIVALVFRCHVTGGTPRPTTESSAVEWFLLSTALAQMTEAYAIRVSDAFAETGTAFRTHDGMRLTRR